MIQPHMFCPMRASAHSNMRLNMMRGEHRQLAGRGVLLVFCHIHDTGTRRLEVRDAENLAIHLQDGGEVRVVGHQVDLPSAEMAMSIIALCAGRASTATAKLSDIAQASVIAPFPCRRRPSTPLRRCRPAGQQGPPCSSLRRHAGVTDAVASWDAELPATHPPRTTTNTIQAR